MYGLYVEYIALGIYVVHIAQGIYVVHPSKKMPALLEALRFLKTAQIVVELPYHSLLWCLSAPF